MLRNVLKATVVVSLITYLGCRSTQQIETQNPPSQQKELNSVAPNVIQWDGNGHWYKAVYAEQGITWDEANRAAIAAGGYLVYLSSANGTVVTSDRTY